MFLFPRFSYKNNSLILINSNKNNFINNNNNLYYSKIKFKNRNYYYKIKKNNQCTSKKKRNFKITKMNKIISNLFRIQVNKPKNNQKIYQKKKTFYLKHKKARKTR